MGLIRDLARQKWQLAAGVYIRPQYVGIAEYNILDGFLDVPQNARYLAIPFCPVFRQIRMAAQIIYHLGLLAAFTWWFAHPLLALGGVQLPLPGLQLS